MIVMIRLILSSLCLITVNCQLAHIWLDYNLFQCAQNTRNYRESVHHQYLCTSSLIWTCISDVNEYSQSSVLVLKYICGFIDGQNALQRHTVWNIHLKPNINIHFLKFELFDYYWFCDYEYLRVSGNNKSSTFCGNRLPWVHDAAATSVNIILMTHVQRAGTKNYQLELLYYATYVLNYEHFDIFVQPFSDTNISSLIDIHLPNTAQNALESFHFISSNRLDIVNLKAINICNKGQVICYDGPGFKSPVLQFTYNQSVLKCRSSTFQMMCKFSRVDDVCTSGPRIYYHASRNPCIKLQYVDVAIHDPITGAKYCINCPTPALEINESKSKGTTKYIHSNHWVWPCLIHIIKMDISFPYMLSEGNSCMYGGLYIVRQDAEILSLCTSPLKVKRRTRAGFSDLFFIIIHYSEYSSERILLYAEYSCMEYYDSMAGITLHQTHTEDTLSVTLQHDYSIHGLRGRYFIYSLLFRHGQIHYINISVNKSAIIEFDAQYTPPCVTVTIFHPSGLSNMWFILDHHKENGSWTMFDRTTTFWAQNIQNKNFY